MRRRCCRPTTRPTASTTSRTCSGVSPSLQERYLSARGAASARWPWAIRATRPGSDTYRVPQDLSQNQHVEGLPLGTVGGLRVRAHVSARRRVPVRHQAVSHQPEHRAGPAVSRATSRLPSTAARCTASRSAAPTTWRSCSTRRPTPATPSSCACGPACACRPGPHVVTAAFIDHMGVKDAVRLQPFLRASADNFDWAGWPHIQTFAVTGPFDATGSGRHAEPPRGVPLPAGVACRRSARCAERILSRLARRAYRQPVGAAELAPILEFYDAGAGAGHVRGGHPARAAAHPGQPAVRLPQRARPGGLPPGARASACPTSSWRRACRSSSGAASRTTSC